MSKNQGHIYRMETLGIQAQRKWCMKCVAEIVQEAKERQKELPLNFTFNTKSACRTWVLIYFGTKFCVCI